jgi:hypothetical protein
MNGADLGFFQIALLVVVAILFCGSVIALIKGWAGRREGLIWTAIWLAAGVAILWPNATSKIAQALGIGRGADLIFYSAVVVMLIGFWAIYVRLRQVRKDVTLLVRHLALLEGEKLPSARPGERPPPEENVPTCANGHPDAQNEPPGSAT